MTLVVDVTVRGEVPVATVEVSVDELTLVIPLRVVVAAAPRVRVCDPRDTAVLANLALAIDPANIVLVTVLVSPVVIKVPVVAGSVATVPVPAVALARS